MEKPDPKLVDFSHLKWWLDTNGYREFRIFLQEKYPNEPKRLVEKMYWYYNNIMEHPKCPECGKLVRFASFNRGYKTYCCRDCAMIAEDTKQTRKQTYLKKYGVDHPSKLEKIQEQRKKTCLEKYGTENPIQSEEIRKKAEKTCLEKYGVEHFTNREKMYNTCMEKYGSKSFLTSNEGQKKSRFTKKEKYGDENYTNREKWHQTCIEKYGVETPLLIPEFQEKIKQTRMEKYGVDTLLIIPEFQEKMQHNRKIAFDANKDDILNKTKQTNLERYGVEWCCMRPEARLLHSNDSKPNISFANLLDEYHINYTREKGITNKSYDFVINDILIEINPYATHNSTWGLRNAKPKDKNYHMDKMILAEQNGYRCICVWDWDRYEDVIKLIDGYPKTKIYARKCEVKLIKRADTFLIKHHIQGTCKGQKVCIGLFYNDEPIQVMTFGKPRYNKNYEWELLRLCTHSDFIVVGGSEKLFKYFIEHYEPKTIISYCDKSKFSGKVYERLNFKALNKLTPSKHWYNPKTKDHITDNLLRQKGFDKLFHTNYGKGTSNNELMKQYGYVEIYDCGQQTYIWEDVQ